MKHPKFNVSPQVCPECNPGKMIHDLFTKFKNQPYEKVKSSVTKYLKDLNQTDLEKMHKSSQLILEANKEYELPQTQVTFFFRIYPGLMEVISNFLDPEFHSTLKTKVTGV